MADVVEQGERKGLSRRDMIKASAAAGAAAWTAPVIVDSLASPAAAVTGNTGILCSKSLVFFSFGGVVYIAGYQDNACQTCGCFGNFSSSNLNNLPCACVTCNGVTYRIGVGTTTATYGATCASAATVPTVSNYPTCEQYLAASGGGTVSAAQAGVTILAAIGFGGNTLNGYCPSSNQITGLQNCNQSGGGNAPISQTCS
jgi:hypothetical protein